MAEPAVPKGCVTARSCYVLELAIPTGGARRADVFAYAKKEQIRACLQFELDDKDRERLEYVGALALDAGETIIVWTIQKGVLESALPLYPHIFVSLDRKAPRPDRAGGTDLYSRLAETPELPLRPPDAHYDALDTDVIRDWIHFRIDWPAIERRLPPLRGPRLRAGETLAFRPNRSVSRAYGRRSYVCGSDDRNWHTVGFGHVDERGGDGGWSDGFREPR